MLAVTDDGKEQKWPAKLSRFLGFFCLCCYAFLWPIADAFLQWGLSFLCPIFGIDVFSSQMISARISASFVTGLLFLVLLGCISSFVRRYCWMVLLAVPIYLVASFFFCYVTEGSMRASMTLVCSRPINLRLISPSFGQLSGCFFPNICPSNLNWAVTSYLKRKGEEDRYSRLVPGFVCRLVARDASGGKSYRVEAENGSETKLYCTQEMMANTQVVPLSHEQVEKLKVALAALKPQESELKLVPSPENIFVEYQIAGQYFYMQGCGKGELQKVEKLLSGYAEEAGVVTR